MSSIAQIFIVIGALSAVVQSEKLEVPSRACEQVKVEIDAKESRKGIVLRFALHNGAEEAVFVLGETPLFAPFRWQGETLWYDVSASHYLSLRESVLSVEGSLLADGYVPHFIVLNPGEVHREEHIWRADRPQRRATDHWEAGVRFSCTESMPNSKGREFVEHFGDLERSMRIERLSRIVE